MFLGDIPDGTSVMVDANIIAYHAIRAEGLTDVIAPFLERVETGSLRGFTTTVLVAEALHRVMAAEAAQAHSLPAVRIVQRLKEKPDLVRTLPHRPLTRDVLGMRIGIEVVTTELLTRAEALFTLHGLLTNDSITLAVMEHLGLTHIATNDDDFDAVPGLTVWKPR